METKSNYYLKGCIQYLSYPIGFVTPVFSDIDNEYFIQVSEKYTKMPIWEKLPQIYFDKIAYVKEQINEVDSKSIYYGFRWHSNYFFGNGNDMEAYLANHFCQSVKEENKIATSFIKTWRSLEPEDPTVSSDDIWNKCLEYVSSKTLTFAKIFSNNFRVKEFRNNILYLNSINSEVKTVFEKRFKNEIIDTFQKVLPGFGIEIDMGLSFDKLPAMYFGAGTLERPQGSFFIQTSIKDFQDFENYIISDFNTIAYNVALNFSSYNYGAILAIEGSAGSGKSHILNSVAKLFLKRNSLSSIGLFTAFGSTIVNDSQINSELELLEHSTLNNDIILIDDLDRFSTAENSIKKIASLLNHWKSLNKLVIYTSRMSIYQLIESHRDIKINVAKLSDPRQDEIAKIIKSKSDKHNLKLSASQIIRLSKNKEIRGIADFQSEMVRIDLFSEFNMNSMAHLGIKKMNIENSRWLETSINEYFIKNSHLIDYYAMASQYFYRRIITEFIKLVFVSDHNFDVDGSSEKYYFISADSLQNIYFENETFREIVMDILSKSVPKPPDK